MGAASFITHYMLWAARKKAEFEKTEEKSRHGEKSANRRSALEPKFTSQPPSVGHLEGAYC
jgi:hypothetical protein